MALNTLKKAIRASSTSTRVIWTIVLISTVVIFCVQFAQLLSRFKASPKKVTIESVPAIVPFPSISLCNMRNLDVMVLNSLNDIFKNHTDPKNWTNVSQDPFINAYMTKIAKYYPIYIHGDIDMKTIQMVLTRSMIATNIDRHLVQDAGVPFKEFIVTCRHGGLDCDKTKEFTQFFDPYYFNCFTYTAPEQTFADTTLAEGLENGWSTVVLSGSGMLDQNEELRLIPGSHEYFSPVASNEGVRIVIHPPHTEPFPHTEGFDVPPGFSASLGVKARLNLRMSPPHGKCSHVDPSGFDKSRVYRLISCQKNCLQQEIVKQCGCKVISLPNQENHPNLPYCTQDDDIPETCQLGVTWKCLEEFHNFHDRLMCVRNTTASWTRNVASVGKCKCFPPCREVGYDVTYSLSKWPADSIDGDETYIELFETEDYPARFKGPEDSKKFELFSKYFDVFNRRQAMKDFIRLNVYIADTNVLKIEESPDYTQIQLVSDTGGLLALWLCISVVVLVILDIVTDLCKSTASTHGHYNKGLNLQQEEQ